jgi:hypothetical protein
VVSSGPIGAKATMPHHIEYETPPGRPFSPMDGSRASFVLDITDPLKPGVSADFKRAGDYVYPHSFARLPGGNILATFQSTGDKYAPPGALVELGTGAAGRLRHSDGVPGAPNEQAKNRQR